MSISKNKTLICDVSGRPHHWATAEDSIILKYKGLLSYEVGDPAEFFGGTQRVSGNRSSVEVGTILFLKESLNYDSRTPPLTNNSLFQRDQYTCLYCGRKYPVTKLSRDHIHPTSKGGKNTWENSITCCKTCNHHKADKMLHETDMMLLAIPYVPNHAERLIMQNKNILADQMEFLTGFLPEHSRLVSRT